MHACMHTYKDTQRHNRLDSWRLLLLRLYHHSNPMRNIHAFK